MRHSRLHHWLPASLTGAHLLRDAIPSLCPLLQADTLPGLCVTSHPSNGVYLVLLMVARVWRTSQNSVHAKFAEDTQDEARRSGLQVASRITIIPDFVQMQAVISVQQPCSNPSKSPEMLGNASTQKYGDLQAFCTLENLLANYRAAFTRQRSLVRSQHRPFPKYLVLQVIRGRQEHVPDTLRSHCAATVQQRGGEPVNVTVLGERNHNAKQKDT